MLKNSIKESYSSIPAFMEMVFDLFQGNFVMEENNEAKKQIKEIAATWTSRAKSDPVHRQYVPLFEKIEKELAEKFPTN